MPSDFLSPFLDLDEEFLRQTFRGLEAPDGASTSSASPRVLGFQRRHSLSPVTLPNSKFNSSSDVADCSWGLDVPSPQHWNRQGQLPRSCLSHIPFRVDRSVSMIEGSLCVLGGGEDQVPHPSPSLLLPPPGLCVSNTSLSSTTRPLAPSPHISTRYKTELCRTYDESGTCKYGAKCQFAHGLDELRGLSRHPKYKTEPCRTFHTIGFCPYGARCHFIHNADELLPPGAAPAPPQQQKLRPPLLRHSISFAGFSTPLQGFQPVEEVHPSSVLLTRASSVSPSTSSGSPELLSPFLPEPGPLKHCPYLFSGVADLVGNTTDSTLHFSAVSDSAAAGLPASTFNPKSHPGMTQQLPVPLSALTGLHRCSSADSLSEEGYTSSCSLSSCSSGVESPSFEGRRLPIFSRLSITDE